MPETSSSAAAAAHYRAFASLSSSLTVGDIVYIVSSDFAEVPP